MYAAPNLIPGSCAVHATYSGLRAFDRQDITLEGGGDVHVDVVLQPREQNQTITVTGDVPAITTTNEQLGGTISGQSWLDQQGKPHTEKLHMIERYRRLDKNTIQLDFTIDDPGAYTKPFKGQKKLTQTKVPFMQNPWVCSTRELQEHEDKKIYLSAPASPEKN